MLEVAFSSSVPRGHKGMDIISKNTQVCTQCSISAKGPKLCRILHSITQQEEAWTIDTCQDGSIHTCCFHQILTPSESD